MTEKKYIDVRTAEKLITDKLADFKMPDCDDIRWGLWLAVRLLADVPAADVVNPVYCKECRNYIQCKHDEKIPVIGFGCFGRK